MSRRQAPDLRPHRRSGLSALVFGAYLRAILPLSGLGLVACNPYRPDTGGPCTEVWTHAESHVTEDTAWEPGIHVLEGSLSIEGARLEIPACSSVRVPGGHGIYVGRDAALQAAGTEPAPITFTTTVHRPQPGTWAGLVFQEASRPEESVLEHVVIEYAGSAGRGALALDAASAVAVRSATLRQAGGVGLELVAGASLEAFEDSTITGCEGAPVLASAWAVHLLEEGSYTGNGDDTIRVSDGEVATAVTWHDLGVPYRLEGSLHIRTDSEDPAVLTLEAGVELGVYADLGLSVGEGGGLVMAGTAEDPVEVTSGQDPPLEGDWGAIELLTGSASGVSRFEHARIRHGGGFTWGQVYVYDGSELEMASVELSEGAGYEGCDVYVARGGELDATGVTGEICWQDPS